MNKQLFSVLFFILPLFVHSTSIVVINSNDWRAAFLASTFSQYNDFPIKFVTDPAKTDYLLEDVASYKPDSIYLFSHESSPAAAITHKLRSLGASIQEITFKNHFDLGQKIAERIDCTSAIIVRDDFGYDALSSKYFAKTSQSCVFFASGASTLPPETLSAINTVKPRKIFLVGTLSQSVDSQLAGFPTERVAGRDEYETSQAVFSMAVSSTAPQIMISTATVLDAALLNDYTFPILVVPSNGTYSLFRTATLLQSAETKYVLAVGRGITETSYWLRDRTGAKVLVKLGTMRSAGKNSEMEKQDVSTSFEGYDLPAAVRSGRISSVRTEVFELLDPLTGNAIMGNRKAAPPLYITAEFENNGNIEYPVSVMAQVFDAGGGLLQSFESEPRVITRAEKTSFSFKWPEPPGEANYKIVVSAQSDVFDGIRFEDKNADAAVTWLNFWLKAALFAALFSLLAFAAAMAFRTSRVRHKFKKSTEKIKDGLGSLVKK